MSELIDRFEKAAAAHGRYQDAQGNAHAAELAEIRRALRENDSLTELRSLLTDNDISVRTWAATYLLDVDPAHAVPVLEQASRDTGIVGFAAEQTLIEWRAGRLQLP